MSSIFDEFNSDFSPSLGNLPVFNEQGVLQGNLTSGQGQAPTSNALSDVSLPAIGGSAASAAGATLPQAAAAVGITGGATPPASTTGTTAEASLSSWFTRAVIVILGFVFVAVGLSQFGVVQRFSR